MLVYDFNDFEVGKWYNLEFINIFIDDGLINSNGGKLFVGMKCFDVCVIVVKDLEVKVSRKWDLQKQVFIGDCIYKFY